MAEYDQMGNYTGYDDMYGYNTMPDIQPTSPQFYDDFGNPVANAEEEKRKREEIERQIEAYKKQQAELGSEVRNKQEVITYADGSQTITTKREVPGQRSQLQPVMPDQTAYNANIAQQESGNRPNIGYHDRNKGTAYGTYGMTAAGYADARRRDPSLPADITQATPEQQTQAQNAYTQQNARYLQNYGVPVNDKTLGAAHFLGAKGLSDFLKTGYISPQAAAANGGVENVKRIVQQRLGGQPAPASGGVQAVAPQPQQQVQQQPQQPQARPQPVSPAQSQAQAQAQAPQPQAEPEREAPRMAPNSFDEFGTPRYSPEQAELDKNLKSFEAIQNDPKALMNFEGPEWMQNNAKMRAADIMANERGNQKAQETLATATPTDLARYLQGKTKSGEDYNLATRVRAMLFSAAGQKELAMREMNKLDTVGTDKYVQGSDGKAYLVRQRADGELLGGYNAETGSQLTPAELVKVGAGTQGAGKVSTSAEMFQDKDGNIYRSQSNEQGQLVTRNIVTGKVYAGDPTKLTRVRDVAGEAADVRKQEYKRENDATSFANSIRKLDYDSKLKAVAEFRQKAINRGEPDLTDAELSAMGVDRPDIGATPARQPAGTAPAAAQAAPPTPGKLTPAVPDGGAQSTAVAPGGFKQPSVSGRMSPEEQDRIAAQKKLEREAASEVQTTEQKEFVKETKPAVGQTSSDGQAVANARRQQLDIVKNNPSIVNIMNGQGTQYDQARRIMINAVSGAYGAEERQQLSNDLGQVMNKLTEAEQGALTEFVNLNTVVNAKTLRANAGPGAVSDAEQRANKEANVGNVDRIPAYAALAGLHRSQFTGDLAASKQAFLQANPQFKTTSEFNSAWQKQEALRLKEYQAIAKARFDIMGKAPAPSAGPEAIKAYRDRVFRAFEAYPAPQFDMATNKWNYQTANARRAAMAAVLGQ